MSFLSSLSFVLLFDDDLKDNNFVPVKPNCICYVLPGKESDYTNPLDIINDIVFTITDCVVALRMPSGNRVVIESVRGQALNRKAVAAWDVTNFIRYYALGMNPVILRPSSTQWVVWGQNFFDDVGKVCKLTRDLLDYQCVAELTA